MNFDIEDLERVYHLALSRAEDKHEAMNPDDPEDVADVKEDGRALERTEMFIRAVNDMGGE